MSSALWNVLTTLRTGSAVAATEVSRLLVVCVLVFDPITSEGCVSGAMVRRKAARGSGSTAMKRQTRA